MRNHVHWRAIYIFIPVALPDTAFLAVDVVDICAEVALARRPNNYRTGTQIQPKLMLSETAQRIDIFNMSRLILPWPASRKLAFAKFVQEIKSDLTLSRFQRFIRLITPQ
ncbi:hypothetical protein D3C76_1077910 [compost metagenome]